MVSAAIGVGANLGDAPGNVHEAIRRLGALGPLIARSDLYVSTPWGVSDQPAFYNAAALLDVELAPHALLAALKALEVDLGRTPGPRWGPRRIDLDILTYGSETIASDDLQVPHRFLCERAFALGPLADLDQSYRAKYLALPRAVRAEAVRIPRSKGDVPARPTDYERAAARYDEERGSLARDRDPLLAALRCALGAGPGKTIVDLGCGTGRFALGLAKTSGASLIGIDASEAMLARARAKSSSIVWVHAHLPEGVPERFDAACAVASLHHLSAQERAATFAKVAAAGAAIAVLTFDHKYFVEHPLAAAFPSFLDIELSRFPPVPRITAELKAAGFSDVSVADVPFDSATSSYGRAAERAEAGYVSTFALMSDAELREGLDRLRAWERDGKAWKFDSRAVMIAAATRG